MLLRPRRKLSEDSAEVLSVVRAFLRDQSPFKSKCEEVRQRLQHNPVANGAPLAIDALRRLIRNAMMQKSVGEWKGWSFSFVRRDAFRNSRERNVLGEAGKWNGVSRG